MSNARRRANQLHAAMLRPARVTDRVAESPTLDGYGPERAVIMHGWTRAACVACGYHVCGCKKPSKATCYKCAGEPHLLHHNDGCPKATVLYAAVAESPSPAQAQPSAEPQPQPIAKPKSSREYWNAVASGLWACSETCGRVCTDDCPSLRERLQGTCPESAR